MARSSQSYRIVAGPEFGNVVKALDLVDHDMPGKFREELRAAADPLAQKARNAVLALPTYGRKHTGLRARVAAGVSVATGGPSLVRIETSMPEPDEAMLPRGLDNGPKGWRHPVYGNRNVWVQQRGYSWFRSTIADGQPELEKDLQGVLDDAADTIDRAGGL